MYYPPRFSTAEVEVARMSRTQTVQQPVANWSDVGQFIKSELSTAVSRTNRSPILLFAIGIAVGILLTVAIIGPVWTQWIMPVGGPLTR